MQTYKSRLRTKKNSKGNQKIFVLFFLICLFVLFLWDVAGPYGIWKLHRIREQRRALYARVIEADRENALLRKKIEDFKKDRHLQEQEVRQKLGWIRKNEVLYRFVE